MSKLAQIKALREAQELRRTQGNHERRNEGKADAVPTERSSSEMPQPSGARAPVIRVAKGIKGGVNPRSPSVQEGCVPLAGRRAANKLTGPDISVSTQSLPTKKGRPRIGEVRDKPWIEAGMSRRTWYRRKAEGKKP